ncbi:uncharacterized protein LOC135121823 [Zophobas morio]|uniref:uncharacterized protein LOC135121823 n=1 Tax=Zophobas morio TaxID=2755281 RepID=UPI003082E893
MYHELLRSVREKTVTDRKELALAVGLITYDQNHIEKETQTLAYCVELLPKARAHFEGFKSTRMVRYYNSRVAFLFLLINQHESSYAIFMNLYDKYRKFFWIDLVQDLLPLLLKCAVCLKDYNNILKYLLECSCPERPERRFRGTVLMKALFHIRAHYLAKKTEKCA